MAKKFETGKPKLRNPFSTSCSSLTSIVIENIVAAAAAGSAATPPPVVRTVKCILVGDAVGKSSLVRSFISSNGLGPAAAVAGAKYAPTAWEDYSVHKRMKDVSENGTGITGRLQLTICDAGGRKEMDRLRPLCYNKVDVVIMCFSVINPSSFNNVTARWLPEIKRHAPEAKIMLVGTQSDLRSNTQVLLQLSRRGLAPIPELRAVQLTHKIGAQNYVECSSLTYKNVQQVFDYALTWGLQSAIGDQNGYGGACPNHTNAKKKRRLMSKDWISKTFSKLKKLLFVSYI